MSFIVNINLIWPDTVDTAIECSTNENTLIVGNNSTNGYIAFSAGSTMTFNHNNKNYSFNVDKAIEQGILTI